MADPERLAFESEIWLQGGKAQWQGSEWSSVRNGGSRRRDLASGWSIAVAAFGAEQDLERWQSYIQGGKAQWQRSEPSSVWSDGRRAFQDWHVKGEMNRSTSGSEIGPQSGKAQWPRSEQSNFRSGGRRAFQDWRAKGHQKNTLVTQ